MGGLQEVCGSKVCGRSARCLQEVWGRCTGGVWKVWCKADNDFSLKWDKLGQVGTSWDKLGQVGTSWNKLEQVGAIWEEITEF